MNTKRTRLLAAVLGAVVLSAPVAMAIGSKVVFTRLRGDLRVVQGVPCGGAIDVRTTIADGQMEVTPSAASRIDGGGRSVRFDLTKLDLFFTPFAAHHECLGVSALIDFREIGVRLLNSVTFTGEPVGGLEDRLYRFSIPKSQVLIFESVLDNMPVPQPETAYQRPSEDVTGEIDLRRGTAQLHIALSTQLRFRVGCVGKHCLIDELRNGKQTANVTGVLVSPTTDTDLDGVPDLTDNCPLVPNPRQQPVPTPIITAPPNATLSSCQAPNIGAAQATDVCHARRVAITTNAPARFAVGRNLVTWTGNDGIDEIVTAQQLVTVGVADRTPPVVSCTIKSPGMFEVFAADDCDGRTSIQLGSYQVASGEVIKIEETGKTGVRLIGTVGVDKTKHFQVGKGQGVIVATDASGNVSRVSCTQVLETRR